MRVFIDARHVDPGLRPFGMGLVERLLHALRRSALPLEEIRIAVAGEEPGVPPDHPMRQSLRARPLAGLPISWIASNDALGALIGAAMASAPEASWLVFAGETIVDARLLPQLAALEGNVFFTGGEGEERGTILRLAPGSDPSCSAAPSTASASASSSGADATALAEALAAAGRARPMRRDEFDGYIVNLRRELEPYVFAVRSDAARKRVERFLFWSNYKGSTDFMTKYVWPPLVWLLVRPLARWRVHPNWVTGVSILATVAAIPLWMEGWWGTGFFLAYLMSLLDSVDGKLARLTFSYSKLGDVLDHGLDIVHPPFWYLGWAAGLSGGDPGSIVHEAAIWMFWLYVADRLCAPIFRARTGRSIHGYLPIDEKIRTFISRRNVNLPFFTAAVAIDALAPGPGWPIATAVFLAIVAWQAVCLVYHVARTIQFFNAVKGSAPA
ncbi:MAG: CDP-alcohol phosphatidyltransferase family protein [Myxococcota bacterium]